LDTLLSKAHDGVERLIDEFSIFIKRLNRELVCIRSHPAKVRAQHLIALNGLAQEAARVSACNASQALSSAEAIDVMI